MSEGVILNEDILGQIESRAVFTQTHRPVNSASFSKDGNYLLTSADDDSIHIYDVVEGKLAKTFTSRRFGARLSRFLHSGNSTAIVANKIDVQQDLRYWDFYENRYIRKLSGHKGIIKDVMVHPFNDTIISVDDYCAMVWDLRKSSPICSIPFLRKSFIFNNTNQKKCFL